MVLMREPTVMYDDGFEADLFDLGGYGYAHDEPAGAYVLTFDCPAGRSRDSAKRQCGASRKTPQSLALAAKNRWEKISERLRTLQELVPGGTKLDMVTMLGKAISYVKFLQLQVKVLATDEFWPAQGGMAPEISQSQVKNG